MIERSHTFWESLEPRELLATITDSEWAGKPNSTQAAAQGLYKLLPADTMTVQGTVGGADAADWLVIRPTTNGTLTLKPIGSSPAGLAAQFSNGAAQPQGSFSGGASFTVNALKNYYLTFKSTSDIVYYNYTMSFAASVGTVPSTSSMPLNGVPQQRLDRIGKGMAIARWFWTPNYESGLPRSYTTNFIEDGEVRAIYSLGFRHIRMLMGMEMMFASTGQTASNYNSAFSRINAANVRDWYSSEIPTSGIEQKRMYAHWTTIRTTVKRLIALANATRGPNDAPLIVSLCPYEVATIIENGPYNHDTDPANAAVRYGNFATWYQTFFKFMTTGKNALSPDEVAFELINEPNFYGRASEFKVLQRGLIQKMREVDTEKLYTLVAPAPSGNGATVGDIRGLLPYTLTDADRGNIIYTMRFYDPGQFASQGARSLRVGGVSYVGWMHSMPWPSTRASVMELMPGYVRGATYDNTVPGFDTFYNGYYSKFLHFYQDGYVTPQFMADRLYEYGYGVSTGDYVPYYTPGSGFNITYLKGRMRQLVDWAAQNNCPVMVGEFGVNASFSATGDVNTIGDGDTTNDDRGRYFANMKSVLDYYHLPWLLWGYDDFNAYGLIRAKNLAASRAKDHSVDLSILSQTGRLLTNADGTFNYAKVDFDVTVALGLNTRNPVTTQTLQPSALPSPSATSLLFSSRAIRLLDDPNDDRL